MSVTIHRTKCRHTRMEFFQSVPEHTASFLNFCSQSPFSIHIRLDCHNHKKMMVTSFCIREGRAGIQHSSDINRILQDFIFIIRKKISPLLSSLVGMSLFFIILHLVWYPSWIWPVRGESIIKSVPFVLCPSYCINQNFIIAQNVYPSYLCINSIPQLRKT